MVESRYLDAPKVGITGRRESVRAHGDIGYSRASVLRLDVRGALRDANLLARLLDTFVVAQLRGERATSESRPRLYHLREEHGRHEVDLVAELGGGSVLAFEIKADAAPDRDAARHLIWLRDRLGDRLVAGVVFGPRDPPPARANLGMERWLE
jgi:Domain of unknown function (DUF4143)